MRVPITKELNLEQLKSELERDFPGIKCVFRGKKVLVVSEAGKSAAAQVMARKNKAIVNEGFASMGGQMVFVFSILFLGVLIPFIVYYAAFFPKQKAIRNKVADYIKQNYAVGEIV